ncbi:MAG: alpha-glucuronidase family glycosyl hydrolase, partial [Planctomycetota bacterium]
MRHSSLTFLILWLVTICSCQGRALSRSTFVDIVISPEATTSEKIAAVELSNYLSKLYSENRFQVVFNERSKAVQIIYIGCLKSFPRLREYIGDKELTEPESYIITTYQINERKTGTIFGSDPAGVMYGIYNLLEKLGCGFYLSYETFPSGPQKKFSFDGWEIYDVPLVQQRIVFNWHNFLSGCSTWNLSDWKSWIIQAQKMGYNGVMVHAYGNNPMVKFSFNGRDKPVGYLSTTQKGRDWSTQHVNDVRRLWGGFVFENPVFGSEAAIVSDTDRADA